MLRYASPSLFFLVAFYVHWHNNGDNGSIWVLPFITAIWPETANDMAAKSDKTVLVLIALGLIFAVLQVFKDRRFRKKLKGHYQEPGT